jgi:hypothetical protein
MNNINRMKFCTNCGVELDDDMKFCPLCGKVTGLTRESNETYQADNSPSDIIMLHRKESRRNYWELSGIILFSGIVVCAIVDLVIGKGFSWSRYAITAMVAAWIIFSLMLLAFKKYYLIIPGLLVTILSMLFLFDLFSGNLNWFFQLGLPITVAVFVFISIVVVLRKVARFKGFNILAFSFLALSGFCIVIEVFIDKYLYDIVNLRWSIIVAVSLLPISLVLLFMHYRMHRGKRLDSYFHV